MSLLVGRTTKKDIVKLKEHSLVNVYSHWPFDVTSWLGESFSDEVVKTMVK